MGGLVGAAWGVADGAPLGTQLPSTSLWVANDGADDTGVTEADARGDEVISGVEQMRTPLILMLDISELLVQPQSAKDKHLSLGGAANG